MMVSVVAEIDWQEPEVAIPAFLTMLAIPLSFSIANGLAFGFTAYVLIKLLRGKFREVNWFGVSAGGVVCAALRASRQGVERCAARFPRCVLPNAVGYFRP